MEYSWQKLEDIVRSIASLHWGCEARAEHIAGVDFDAVLRPSGDEIILVEVSKNESLNKVREDIIKIQSYRTSCFNRSVMCRGYIVFEEKPTLSMIETGKNANINVLSLDEFVSLFFNFNHYNTLRIKQPFGSSLDPFSGKKDQTAFVPVEYIYRDKEIGVSDIVDFLSKNKKNNLNW